MVARRYAQALYEEAERQELVAGVDEDVDLLQESFEAAPELARLYRSPVIPREKKKAVSRSLLEERLRPLTFRFVLLLIEKKREELLRDVLAAYRTLRDQQEGVVEAAVRTAQALGEGEQEKLAGALGRMTGREVRLQVQKDEALIGGLVVRIGDTVYDGSVQHQLKSLRERLVRQADVAGAVNGSG